MPATPFPARALIVFLTFSVILATLVGQGLTLPLVIRALGLEDDGVEDREDAKARIYAAEAALARLEDLVRRGLGARRHGRAHARRRTASAPIASGRASTLTTTARSRRARRTSSASAVSSSTRSGWPSSTSRRSGAISNDVWLRVGRDLDLEDERLDS